MVYWGTDCEQVCEEVAKFYSKEIWEYLLRCYAGDVNVNQIKFWVYRRLLDLLIIDCLFWFNKLNLFGILLKLLFVKILIKTL